MNSSERMRISTVFGMLGLVALAVIGRLVQLQIFDGGGEVLASLRKSERRTRSIPAPRGTIVDRNGVRLAYDRPAFEARAELTLKSAEERESGDYRPLDFLRAIDRAVHDFARAVGKGKAYRADAGAEDRLRERLYERIANKLKERAAKRPLGYRARVDVLITSGIEEYEVAEALKALDYRRQAVEENDVARRRRKKRPYSAAVHLIRRYERVYPAREATLGVVGLVQKGPGVKNDDRVGVTGLECLKLLQPRAPGSSLMRVRGGGIPYWTGERADYEAPLELESTLDLQLQEFADRQIESAAQAVSDSYGDVPEWGALVLVEVATGDVLAASSYTAAKDGSRDRHGAFAPTQKRIEPGSVVKPLHIAMGLERRVVDWNAPLDCRPGYSAGSEYSGQVGRLPRRTIRDSHPNGVHTPHEVIVRSSNIGAVKLGLKLGSEGLEDYLRLYGFGRKTGVMLHGEVRGQLPGERKDAPRVRLPQMRRNEQYVYTGPSVCFGYQFHTTAMQVARSFLTFVSGRQREIRLVRRLAAADQQLERVRAEGQERFLSPATIATVTKAMIDVVHDEHGTARRLGRQLTALGMPRDTIAGKTGTSEYRAPAVKWNGEKVASASIRTASFVGFAPAFEPRYLVVCVLQKVGASSFYGGKYAAPAAGRMLLRALERGGVLR